MGVGAAGNDTKLRSLTVCILGNLGFMVNGTGETEECLAGKGHDQIYILDI